MNTTHLWLATLLFCTALSAGVAAQDPAGAGEPRDPLLEPPAAATEEARPSSDEFPYEGEVTGNNVYVRSGAGSNWYPTTKLNVGARVRVIGEESGWLKIVPPAGSFSYVDASVIERSADGSRGTTTVDGVYVKAGSELSRRKIATQQILPRGAEVTILGEADGFYKIVPPEGSYLFISKLYVERAGATPRATDATSAGTGGAEPGTGDATGSRVKEFGAAPTPAREAAPSTPPPPKPGSKYRAMLEAAEAELQSLLAARESPAGYAPLIERYQPIAEQEEDPVARAVAALRVEQLTARAELERMLAEARVRGESLEVFRQKLAEDRERIRNARVPPELRAWDYKGELRVSKAFGAKADRYRLVDPFTQATLAYVDIPLNTGLDAARFVNRYVGIRVSGQYFSTSARVPIAVAMEVALLRRPGAPVEARTPSPAAQSLPPMAEPTKPGLDKPPGEGEADDTGAAPPSAG